MKASLICRIVGLVVAPVLVLGCGGSPKQPPSDSKGIETVELGALPPLGAPLPALDEQRIELAGPKGWHIPSRSKRWVVRFQETRGSSYPSIIVRAEDHEGVSEVSEANVAEFAEQVAATLGRDKSAASTRGSLRPIRIGALVGVRYTTGGSAPYRGKRVAVEKYVVGTVAGGRKYTIELQTREGDLEKYRPHLLAVAGGMKCLEAATVEPADEPADEEDPATKPKPKKPDTQPGAEPDYEEEL